ncbi:hypothetical protein T492DRAFT_1061297 [Pavlovales sp. CCMP2436]|nr:hypothetical protein T492DRAFT_1061297 [Pavlovales sp. CCMP2436]
MPECMRDDCQIKEARDAGIRSARRAASKEQESRLLFRGVARDEILRGTHTAAAVCAPCEAAESGEEGGGEEEEDDDAFAALHARRMNEMRVKATNESDRARRGYGAYSLLSEDPSLPQVRGRHLSVVHLAQSGDESSTALQNYLARHAPDYKRFKVYRAEAHEEVLELIGATGRPPALVALKSGALVATLHLRPGDCDDLVESVGRWLNALRERFDGAAGSDEEEEEEEASNYCGKKGCGRNFPHEHVEWKQAKAGDATPSSDSDDFSDCQD